MKQLCRETWGGSFDTLIAEYETGFIVHQHCGCDVCELKRVEEKLPLCKDHSCQACINMASGKKIRKFMEGVEKL